MQMEKWYLSKLFKEWGGRERDKENDRGGDFKYDIFDTL
jgi:hypothetical protein